MFIAGSLVVFACLTPWLAHHRLMFYLAWLALLACWSLALARSSSMSITSKLARLTHLFLRSAGSLHSSGFRLMDAGSLRLRVFHCPWLAQSTCSLLLMARFSPVSFVPSGSLFSFACQRTWLAPRSLCSDPMARSNCLFFKWVGSLPNVVYRRLWLTSRSFPTARYTHRGLDGPSRKARSIHLFSAPLARSHLIQRGNGWSR